MQGAVRKLLLVAMTLGFVAVARPISAQNVTPVPAAVASGAPAPVNAVGGDPAEQPWGHWTHREHRGDNFVPLAFFLFLIILILGGRYFREQTERRRLDLLRMMIDKGQAVPESVVREILGRDRSCSRRRNGGYDARRGAGMTIAGAGLLLFAFLHSGTHQGVIIAGIVLFGLGAGRLLTFSRRSDGSDEPRPPQSVG